MNKDEVMALSNKELQIKAAELAGDWIADGAVFRDKRGKLIIEKLPPEQIETIPFRDYPNDIAAAMGLAETIADQYWLELKTPFQAGDPFFAGFTPLATTGWNGVPDNQCPGEKPGQAITRAFILAMEEK